MVTQTLFLLIHPLYVLTCVNQDEGQLHEPVLILVSADASEPNHAVLGTAAELRQCERCADSGKETAPAGSPAVRNNTTTHHGAVSITNGLDFKM